MNARFGSTTSRSTRSPWLVGTALGGVLLVATACSSGAASSSTTKASSSGGYGY